MKTTIRAAFSFFLILLSTNFIFAQTAPISAWSGQITYEGVRRLPPPRININGEEIKPGDPRFPTDIPDTRMFGMKTLVAGKYAKETRDEQSTVIQVRDVRGGGPPQQRNVERPFNEQVFVDLTDQKKVTLLTVGKDADAKLYQAEAPIQRVSGWQFTDQTKKIAGYTCRKATILYNKETYTAWITTELPINYSPIHELTPDTGTVLLIEGSKDQFKATKVDTSKPDISAVTPNDKAQHVTPEQLADLRQKAIADFQQQLQLNDRN